MIYMNKKDLASPAVPPCYLVLSTYQRSPLAVHRSILVKYLNPLIITMEMTNNCMNDHLDFRFEPSRCEPCVSAQIVSDKEQPDTSQDIGTSNEGFPGRLPGSHGDF